MLVNSLPLILTWTKTATDTALPLRANLLSTACPTVVLTDLTFLSFHLHPKISQNIPRPVFKQRTQITLRAALAIGNCRWSHT